MPMAEVIIRAPPLATAAGRAHTHGSQVPVHAALSEPHLPRRTEHQAAGLLVATASLPVAAPSRSATPCSTAPSTSPWQSSLAFSHRRRHRPPCLCRPDLAVRLHDQRGHGVDMPRPRPRRHEPPSPSSPSPSHANHASLASMPRLCSTHL